MEKMVNSVAAALAVLGGGVLFSMALVTVLSVLARAIPFVPALPGDFELVEMGAAVAVFLFLPWCQVSGGQVSVDLVSQRLGARVHAVLGFLGNLALTAVSGVILWRLWLGFGEKFPFGDEGVRDRLWLGDRPYFTETTYDLLIPVWIPFGLCLPGAVWLVVACLCSTWRSIEYIRVGVEP